MADDTKDMTTGNPARLILAFSMPLMFGNLFQQFYTFADALIVGRCVSASLTYTAQNRGTGSGRIRDGLLAALAIGTATALMMSGIMVAAGQQVLGLFIRETEADAVRMIGVGYAYLHVLAVGFPLLYCLYVVRSCIQGLGDSVFPMLSSFMQVIMRVSCAIFLTRLIGSHGVFFGEVAAWTGADLFLAFVCVWRLRRIRIRDGVCAGDRKTLT